MAFVRHKMVSGRKYYYLVKSERIAGRVCQRVLKYLGTRAPTIRVKGLPAPKPRRARPARGKRSPH